MSLQVDPGLSWIFIVLAGSNWPEGDEDLLRAMAEERDAVGARIGQSGDRIDGLVRDATGSLGDAAGRNFLRCGQDLKAGAQDLADRSAVQSYLLRQHALNIETTKYSILVQLSCTGAEILWALSNPFTAPLAPGFIAAGRLAIQRLMMRYFSRAQQAMAEAARHSPKTALYGRQAGLLTHLMMQEAAEEVAVPAEPGVLPLRRRTGRAR